MFDQLRNLNIESLSFWVGFVAATIFWWLVTRLIPYAKRAWIALIATARAARQGLQTGAEQRLRSNTLKLVQSLHLASPLFALDEILITPRLMAPPVTIIPDQEPSLDYVAEHVIPYMPDFPELAGAYNGHSIPVHDALKGGANLIITGNLGSGKTTALAYLASAMARRESQLGDLKNHVPVFLHANELLLPLDENVSLLTPIIDALTARSTALGQARLPEALKSAFKAGRILLLIDGYDEIAEDAAVITSEFLGMLLDEYPTTRIVAAASPHFVDGLVSLGLVPIPMASWNIRQQALFIQQWSGLWQLFVQTEIEPDPEDETSTQIDPILLNGWLLGQNAALNPLEFTLKVWSAYAGDVRGPKGTDAIEAYLRRMSVGIPRARAALEYLSTRMVRTMRSSFTQAEAQAWTSGFDSDTIEGAGLAMLSEEVEEQKEITLPRVLPDLARNGLLTSRSHNQLAFVHPVLASYLAGTAFAFNGQGEHVLSQPDWPLKYSTIHYLASQSDLSEELAHRLTDTEDPLNRGILQAGSWLRDIPSDAGWQKPILKNLANMLQQDALTMGFRTRVLACLAATNDPGVATMFRHLLRSPKNSVSLLAALGCGFLRDSGAVSDLTNLIIDPTPVGQAACLALVNIGTRPALEAAADVFLNGAEPLRRAVAEAFANHPEEGFPILREGSEIDDLLVRRISIHGLRLIDEPWAKTILEEMQVEDGQWVVRNAAAQVVEELNDLDPYIPRPLPPPEETPWLIEFASDHGKGVSMGDPAREMVLKALREGSPDQTYAALDLCRRSGDAGIFPVIYHLLYGEDQQIAETAYDTLWHLAATGAEIPPPIQFGLGY